jgi:hypothetical protein
MTREEAEKLVKPILHLFERSKPNCSATFINLARALSQAGLSDTQAFEIVKRERGGSHAVYEREVREGRTRPLSLRQDFEKRRALMAANGGRLN